MGKSYQRQAVTNADQTVFCVEYDVYGNKIRQVDENGLLTQSYGYAAFGAIRSQTGADLNRITYTAREALGDSAGLYYYRYRVMDPSTGRFTTEDPLGFIDGPNRYIYVRNNPLRWIDPFGLRQCPFKAWRNAPEPLLTREEADAIKPASGTELADTIIKEGAKTLVEAVAGDIGGLAMDCLFDLKEAFDGRE